MLKIENEGLKEILLELLDLLFEISYSGHQMTKQEYADLVTKIMRHYRYESKA